MSLTEDEDFTLPQVENEVQDLILRASDRLDNLRKPGSVITAREFLAKAVGVMLKSRKKLSPGAYKDFNDAITHLTALASTDSYTQP